MAAPNRPAFLAAACFAFHLSLAVLVPIQACAGEDVVFTSPNCAVYRYSTPVELQGGGTLDHSRGGVFCTSNDFPQDYDSLSGPVGKRITDAIDNSSGDSIKSINIADYIFSDGRIAKYICEQNSRSPFDVTVYTQQSDVSSSPVGIKPGPSSILSGCLGGRLRIVRLGCDVHNVKNCPRESVNTMHLKLLEVKRASGAAVQIASSGNLGKGMYANLEDWIFFQYGSRDDAHVCLWPILDAMPTATKSTLQSQYRECQQKQRSASKLILLPFESDRYYETFYKLATSASSITIVSMDFRDRRLRKSLETAIKRGGRVSFIASSDWYYAKIKGIHQGNADPDDIEIASDLQKKFPNNVTIKFVETNYYTGFGNTLHHKFALFLSAGGATVLGGTTNMNPGAISLNLDQAYVINGQAADKYQQYVNWLNARSYSADSMPKVLPAIDPSGLQ